MFLQPLLVHENTGTVIAAEPMLALLVLQFPFLAAGPTARPAGVAPAAFDFIGVRGAVVEVVADAVGAEVAAAAGGHGGGWIVGMG